MLDEKVAHMSAERAAQETEAISQSTAVGAVVSPVETRGEHPAPVPEHCDSDVRSHETRAIVTIMLRDASAPSLVDRGVGTKKGPPDDNHPKLMNKSADSEPADTPLRSGITLEEMRDALREQGTVGGAAEALGMSGPNFQQQWRRRCEHAGVDQTPAEWLESEGLRELKGDTPRVFFRMGHEEHAQLVEAAKEEDVGPNQLASSIVEDWLKRRAKRAAKKG